MARPFHTTSVGFLLALLVWQIGCSNPREITFKPAPEEKATEFSYHRYGTALRTYVDDQGLVRYSALKASRADLDAFAASLATLKRTTYEGWPKAGKIAFWINAYNALTLEAIIEHYPIKARALASLRYPKNSIRQIPGVWTDLTFKVMGTPLSLDHIEHKILRADFDEARIHMALVCAALGCPFLRREPYRAETLDGQLSDQTRRFLSDGRKFRIDRKEKTVHLSSIFDWFGKDFVSHHAPKSGFPDQDDVVRAVLNFVAAHLSEGDASYLREATYDVETIDYDWTLNEKKD